MRAKRGSRLFHGRGRGGRRPAAFGGSRRVFLVSRDALAAYHWRRGRCGAPLVFGAGEPGLTDFSSYLSYAARDPIYLLADFVEEEFQERHVPHVVGPDRRALVRSRQRRLFGDALYVSALFQGREAEGRRDDRMLFSALRRPDLIEPWVERIARRKAPLAGVYSPPFLTGRILEELPADSPQTLVVTPQNAGGLRQTFFSGGRLRLSRLVAPPLPASGEGSAHVIGEIERFRRYLESRHLLAHGPVLDAHVVADPELLGRLRRHRPHPPGVRMRLLAVAELAARVGLDARDEAGCDRLFAYLLACRPPSCQYAPATRTRYFAMRRARGALNAASLLLAAAGALGCGVRVLDGVVAESDAALLDAHARLYEQRYARARERLPRTPADPSSMRRALEVAGELHAQRSSPMPALRTLSAGLGPHPEVRIDRIEWSASPPSGEGPGARGAAGDPFDFGAGAPGAGGGLHRTLDLEGRIEPFRGDYRKALARVGAFVESLRGAPRVIDAQVLSMPLEVGSETTLSGDAGAGAGGAEALFALRLRLRPDP